MNDKLKEFQDYLERSGYSDNTKNQYMIYAGWIDSLDQSSINTLVQKHNDMVFRAFLKVYLWKFLNRTDIQISKFEGRKKKRLPKFLTPEEINALFMHCAEGRLRIMILLGFESGLRISEMLSLRIVDMQNGTIIGKGNKEERIYITDKAKEMIKEHARQYNIGVQEPIFNVKRTLINKKLKSLSKKVLDKEVNPHMLRHSCGVNLRRKGMDIKQIQKFLRHSDISSTSIYTEVTEKEVEDKWKEIMGK